MRVQFLLPLPGSDEVQATLRVRLRPSAYAFSAFALAGYGVINQASADKSGYGEAKLAFEIKRKSLNFCSGFFLLFNQL